MTFLSTLLASLQIMAHAPVQDLLCSHNNKKIEIQIIDDQAFLKLPQEKKPSLWNMPESADQWDPQNKQIFDNYNFKKDKLQLTLKVPETKGTVKVPFLLFENATYNCREMKRK